MESSMNSVHCFGEALIDLHGTASKGVGEAATFHAHTGGAPANVAVAVAKLGGRAAFVGMFGQDMFADMLLHDLAHAGVDTRHARRTDAANTALAFVKHDEFGERSFSFYRPPSADLLFRDEDFDVGTFVPDSVFHAGSCSLTGSPSAEATLFGLAQAHEAGALTSFDMNLRPALWPRGVDPAPMIWLALAWADVVKLSAEEMAFLAQSAGSEEAVIARLWQQHTELLVVTDGDGAIAWHTREAHGRRAAFKVRAVDTTGAGDAFVGGLLFQLARDGLNATTLAARVADAAWRDATLRFAAACGALAVTRAGSFAAMPTLGEAEQFLETHA
ncbi:MAG TPA: carbohydrate kinase [Rhodanobacteraceae bacterium]